MASLCQKESILIILVIGALVPQLTSRVIPEASMRERHELWMARYKREYKNAMEKEERYKIFKANVECMDFVNNAEGKTYKLSENEFADKTNEEFRETYMAYRNPCRIISAPANIDWRKKGAVTAIEAGTLETVEGITKIKGDKLYTLSVQEILDCNNGGENGCNGGFQSEAFDFIKQNGHTTESNYPSKGKIGKRDRKKEAEPVAKITNNEEALKKAVAKQPVPASIDASGSRFQFYSSGVFTGQCGTTLDHGVTVVGYATENGKLKCWIVKNSWGTAWGEDGLYEVAGGR
ncbi:Cysteine proteinase Cathepsin L [Handroanthus impetiginosus]|uniref:Cysteine proteinase Cathepsin L n=1 Tax=Handroanthus impetiginosus TaxID=429701 RepID=A0A2G9HMV4_9LAMI|nr:Cysteine proteinase Cathepsin L [Handroanthus impetiginosus]